MSPLPRKSSFTDEEVIATWERITELVSREEAQAAVEAAAAEMRSVLGSKLRPALAWSGGKDSLAVEVVYEASGYPMRGVCSVASDLEFPAMLEYQQTRHPENVVLINRHDLNLDWLAKNPRYCFPKKGNDAQVYTVEVTRWGQHEYQHRVHPDVMIMGRRKADGNWFDRSNPYNISKNSHGMVSYSPIRDWSHELTLAVVRYSGKPLPVPYGYPFGWTTGGGPWPGRRMPDPWHNTWVADPSVVERAARYGVAGAVAFMREAKSA